MFEIIVQIVGEIVLDSLTSAFGRSRRADKQTPANPILVNLGWALIGAILGCVSAVVFPRRLLKDDALAIGNLLVSPIVIGTLMSIYGHKRKRSGRATTRLATFWGATAFAFGGSAGRFAVLVLLGH